jgi:hypothetical protein
MADAVSAFKVLLSEVVRDVVEPTNASWRAVLPRLKKDPQVGDADAEVVGTRL